MNDLKVYLQLEAEQERLSRQISDVETAIAVRKQEIED